MSSTSTLTIVSDQIQHGENTHQRSADPKSPPAIHQSVRIPMKDDFFPEGVNQASSSGRSLEQMELDETTPPETQAFDVKESWKNPRINIARMAYIFLVSRPTTDPLERLLTHPSRPSSTSASTTPPTVPSSPRSKSTIVSTILPCR